MHLPNTILRVWGPSTVLHYIPQHFECGKKVVQEGQFGAPWVPRQGVAPSKNDKNRSKHYIFRRFLQFNVNKVRSLAVGRNYEFHDFE